MIPITPPRWPQIGPSLIRAPWRGVYVPGGSFSPLSLGDALAAWWRGDSGLLTGGGRTFVSANKGLFTLSHASTSAAVQVGTGDFSVSLHVNLAATPSAEVVLCGKRDIASGTGWQIRLDSNARLLIVLADAGGTTFIRGKTALTTGIWYHFALAFDRSGDLVVYRNGVALTSSDFFDSLDISARSQSLTGTGALEFGGYSNMTPTEVPSAALSKILILKSLLDQDTVTDLYNIGNGVLAGTAETILATLGSFTLGTDWDFWNLNESTGTADAKSYSGDNDLSPTFGELLADGGLELWASSSNLTNWTESLGAGASITQESSIVDAGTYSSKHIVVSDSQQAAINQSVLTSGHRVAYSVRARNGGSGNAQIYAGSAVVNMTLTTTWTTFAGTVTASGAQFWLYVPNIGTVYFDQASAKAIDILPCDGPAADVASDSIGTNHGAVVVGSGDNSATKWSSDRPAALAGVLDGSFTFDGSNDVIAAPSSIVSASDPRPISISLWFRASSAAKAMHSLFANNQAASPSLYVDLEQVSGSTYRMRLYSSAYTNGSSFTLDTNWHHYVVTWAANDDVAFYVDGTASGTGTRAVGGTATAGVWIGALAGFSGFEAAGNICDVRAYSSVLSAGQAAELAAGSEATGATPVARWKLDDGPQTPVTDGDPVVLFRSKDTGRWQFSQATLANRPEYEATGIGGRGSLVLDGSNDCLSVADDIDTGTSGCLTWVARPSALSGDHVVVSSADVGAANKYFHSGFDSAGKVYVETNVSGTTTRVTGNTVCSTGSDYVVTITSTGSAWSITVNGVAQTLTVTGSNTGNWFGDVSGRDNVVLGALVTSGGTSKLLNGLLGEVVLCTDNTKADQIHAYARAYWGT